MATHFSSAATNKLWTDGTDTFIARDEAHAIELWEAHSGEKRGDAGEGQWVQIPDGKLVEMGFEDRLDCAMLLRQAKEHGLDMKQATVTGKCRADRWPYGGRDGMIAYASWWAQLPAGFLCSSEF